MFRQILAISILSACTAGPTCKEGFLPNEDGNCVPVPEDTQEKVDTHTGFDSGIDEDPPCDTSDEQAEDPMTDLGVSDSIEEGGGGNSLLIELVEVAVDKDREILWGVGQGGLVGYSIADPLAPERISIVPSNGGGRFHHVYPFPSSDIGGGIVYVTHRGDGLHVIDTSNVNLPVELLRLPISGLEGMTQVGDSFYVVSRTGEILSLDISDRSKPTLDQRKSGLSLPWDIVGDEDALYVADNELGVVVLERSDPSRPTVVEKHDVGGGVQALAMNQKLLVAAAGSAGLKIFSRESPLEIELRSTYSVGTSVQDVVLIGDHIWAVTQEAVFVVDASFPTQPAPIASRKTPYWAMSVTGHDGNAWVGDWGAVRGYSVDPTIPAGDIDPQSSEILLDPAGQTLSLYVHNRGNDTLNIDQISTLDPALKVTAMAALDVPVRADLRLEIEWPGGDLDTTLCIRSDDPDESLLKIAVHTGGMAHKALGDPAPDFTLEDLDGVSHTLSDSLGHPVVIAYFATW